MTELNHNHGSTAKHQALGKAFQLAVGQSFDDVMLIPYTVGMFRDFDSAERIVHAGIKGVPDWIAFGQGWHLFFDAKTGHATFSKEQRAFRDRMVQINKGRHVVFKLTSVNEALAIIAQVNNENK